METQAKQNRSRAENMLKEKEISGRGTPKWLDGGSSGWGESFWPEWTKSGPQRENLGLDLGLSLPRDLREGLSLHLGVEVEWPTRKEWLQGIANQRENKTMEGVGESF